MTAVLEHAKNRIRRELDNVLKSAASHSAAGQLPSDVEQLVCNVIEAVFIHGLMDAFFLKGSRYSKYPEPNCWPFISKFTHVSTKKQILALKQIKTEIGKSRAWIRIVLNEGALEHYIQMISSDESQLNQYYVKSAFLRDGEKIEALNGYLKALAKLPLNLSTNSTVLNNWNPKPLQLSGLITEKSPPKNDSILTRHRDNQTEPVNSHFSRLASHDDDEKSSIYSHPSMLDQTEPVRQSFQGFLPGTPENAQILNFQESQRSSDVIVRHRRGRVRSLSKSSNGSSTNISRNISLTAIAQECEEVEQTVNTEVSKEETNEQISFTALSNFEDKSKETSNEAESFDQKLVESIENDALKIDEKAVEAVEMQLTPATEIEPTCSSSFNDSSFQSMSLHDEFVLNGYQDDSGMSGGNSIQGFIWSTPARKVSNANMSTSYSSTSSGPPIMSFDAEMRSVLQHQQSENDADKSDNTQSSSPQPKDSLDNTCETLSPEDEHAETGVMLDSKSEVEVIEDDKELNEMDEFGINRNSMKMITEIQREHGLASQNFRCFSCMKSIGGSSFLPFKVCGLDAKYYCEECMRGIESPIPARIILNWDHKPRPICRASKEFLKTVYDRPIIRIDKVNPLLYDNAPQLSYIHKLRLKLSQSAIYLLSCKKSIAEDLIRRLHPHEYLYTDLHLYSIKDLESVMTGVLERRLNMVINFAIEHIRDCPLCIQKGFICEICGARKVIYPFNLDTTTRCKECFAVYHVECFKLDNCPKCIRKAKKEALAKEAEFVFK